MGELSWLLTVYELAFLLFGVKEAAQVEDDGQKEHEAGHSDDRHRLLPREGTTEVPTPQSAGHVHLKGRQWYTQRKLQLITETGYRKKLNPLRFMPQYSAHPQQSSFTVKRLVFGTLCLMISDRRAQCPLFDSVYYRCSCIL